MTNSKTSSSSNYQDEERLLRGFLEGEYSLAYLQRALEHCLVINFDQHEGHRKIQKNALEGFIKIPVEERHLRQALQRYLRGELSEVELSDWAAFIYLTEIFVPTGETDEERWVAGEGPVWDILQRLISPSVFDGLDQNVVREYLVMLH
jgi:hypothetical protein